MAAIKCVRCGANIPATAAFCPGCGAPKAEIQPQIMVQQVPMSGGSDMQGMIDKLFSKILITIALFIGILLTWIFRIVGQFFAHPVITILGFTFMVGVGGILLCGGFLNKNLDNYSRVGLIIAGGFILALHL